ncbi:cytochrome P450 2J4-like [Argiope bruennichi]|nr:cytochrome P450 2J4-like [Argiope bruennichi]
MQLDNILNVRYEIWIAFGVTVLVAIISSLLKKSRRNFPPGPWGLPVVGYIPFLSKDVHLKFIELAKKYGDVFSLRLGSETVVVLNDTVSIREAFSKQEFLGRPPNSCFSVFDVKSPFFLNDMHMWQEQRRFVIQSLKDLGLGKTKIEEEMQDEINHFNEVLKSFKGKPIDLIKPLTPSMSNNISTLIFGKRYGYDEPERMSLDENLDEVSKIIGQTAVHIFFPWIKHIPFLLNWLGFEKGYKLFRVSDDIFRKKVNEHKKTLDKKNIRDFIDSYLVEMEVRQKKDTKTTFNDEVLLGCVSDIFGAGSETVRTSIGWLMYAMAAYPDVQKKVQKELLEVVGPERSPEYQDHKSLPFSYAVMLEVIRWKTIVPLNLLRYTLADTTVSGYDIPAGTIVMANFWAVHHDPRNWKDPESFKPERFLSSDGKSVVKSPHYMPFSVGKRACPGETMAYMEVFLYFVSIVQKFDVRFPEGYKPTFEGNLTITYKPPSAKICFIPRN